MAVKKIDIQKIDLLIDNKDIPTEQYLEVRDPGRLSDIVGRVAQGTVEHVNEAVKVAYDSFLIWGKTSLKKRIDILSKIEQLLKQETSSIARILSSENGVPLNTSLGEMDLAIRAVQATIKNGERFLQPKQVEDEDSWVSVEKRPIGVIAGIVPWNAPMVLTIQKVAPALIAGNSIVIKPSPNSPIGVSIILKKISELLPPGVINVIHGDGEIGSTLVKHPLVRKVSFTGGGKIAKHVMKDAAETLTGVHFELGGNDPAIVLDDADLDVVVPKIAESVFRRSGQVCFAIKRIYIPHSMYNLFYEKLCSVVDQFKIGHGLDERTTLGPLNNKAQYDYVNQLIEEVKQSNATLTQHGEILEKENWENGYYIMPTIVRDVDPKHEIVSCEQFGPIIPLIPYQSEEEAIKMANDSELGLGSSVWTTDFERGLDVARQIEAGMTFINAHGQSHLGYEAMPFGGVKQSSIGRDNTEVGIAEFIEYHAINYHKPN